MPSDLEIASAISPRPIAEVARGLVLVSAITPTAAGEGKTTTSIGLAQGLARLGEASCLALREPSLGPSFGRKGGATVGLGGPAQGVPRETGFDITAASEVMAILCLAEDEDDLRARLERVLVGFTHDGAPVSAASLSGAGAMLALLREALWPNLVQTLEGAPAFIHGGPFANIAHGCNSVIATRLALHLADWAITEAGFGFDLGAEKFFDIKCRGAGLDTAAVVLVATVRALKMHGGRPITMHAAAKAPWISPGP